MEIYKSSKGVKYLNNLDKDNMYVGYDYKGLMYDRLDNEKGNKSIYINTMVPLGKPKFELQVSNQDWYKGFFKNLNTYYLRGDNVSGIISLNNSDDTRAMLFDSKGYPAVILDSKEQIKLLDVLSVGIEFLESKITTDIKCLELMNEWNDRIGYEN